MVLSWADVLGTVMVGVGGFLRGRPAFFFGSKGGAAVSVLIILAASVLGVSLVAAVAETFLGRPAFLFGGGAGVSIITLSSSPASAPSSSVCMLPVTLFDSVSGVFTIAPLFPFLFLDELLVLVSARFIPLVFRVTTAARTCSRATSCPLVLSPPTSSPSSVPLVSQGLEDSEVGVMLALYKGFVVILFDRRTGPVFSTILSRVSRFSVWTVIIGLRGRGMAGV
jgi:hypothetical protein